MTKKQKREVLTDFKEGYSIPVLGMKNNVPEYVIDDILREALKEQEERNKE